MGSWVRIFFMHYFHNRLDCAHNCHDQSYSHIILHILHSYSSPSTGILWSRKKLGHPSAKTGSYLAVSLHLPAATPPSDCPCLLTGSLSQCHPDISRPASSAQGEDLWPGMVTMVDDLHFSSYTIAPGNRLFCLHVVSPTSRFAYIEVVSPTGPKSFRLHGLSRFTYIEVDSPTLNTYY